MLHTLYSYADDDFEDLEEDPLDTIGIPKLPSQPNKGVRRNFDAILQFLLLIIHAKIYQYGVKIMQKYWSCHIRNLHARIEITGHNRYNRFFEKQFK